MGFEAYSIESEDMVSRFPNLAGTIQRKLLSLAAFSVTLALVLACSVFAVFGVVSLHDAKWQQIRSQAHILALNSAAAVEFADDVQADRLLAVLRDQPSITHAALYSDSGELIGAYPSRREVSVHLAKTTTVPAGNYVYEQPIANDGNVIGHLKILVDLTTVRQAIWKYALLTLLVGLGSFIVAISFAIVLQRGIVRPIDHLARVARQIANDGNYGLRVAGTVDGELGDLYRAFNCMLNQLQSSKQELQEANDHLERRVAERTAELARACEAAMAASRAKSEFLANMSHEIRTPLNSIMGYADLLGNGWVDSPEEREEMISAVHCSGKHLLTVIDDILDLSKIESGRLELDTNSVSPQQIIADVLSLMQASYREKNLSLDCQWQGLIPETITTDAPRLRQILINLLGNARKFTPSGGVKLMVEMVQQSASWQLRVDVKDTGIGIPREMHEKVFEPFVQADTTVTRRFGGSGLGLSISRRLARMMGGDLTLTSEPALGSTFALSIDAGDLRNVRFLDCNATGESTSRETLPAQRNSTPQFQGLRALVVDDVIANQKLIALILTRGGASLTLASNGQEACDLVVSQPFDVILLDMQMPIMDGYEAARKLRLAGITTPIVALTANAMKGDREKCLEAGCTDFISKPINKDELLERMQWYYLQLSPGTTVEATATTTAMPV